MQRLYYHQRQMFTFTNFNEAFHLLTKRIISGRNLTGNSSQFVPQRCNITSYRFDVTSETEINT